MPSWFTRTNDPAGARGLLGPLEWRAMEALWARHEAVAGRDLATSFADIAYTTLMTTLDRLHRKGMLHREKQGRAFVYRPRQTRREFESARAGDAVRLAIQGGGSLAPLASCLVDAVGERDRELLDALESLVQARQIEKGRRA